MHFQWGYIVGVPGLVSHSAQRCDVHLKDMLCCLHRQSCLGLCTRPRHSVHLPSQGTKRFMTLCLHWPRSTDTTLKQNMSYITQIIVKQLAGARGHTARCKVTVAFITIPGPLLMPNGTGSKRCRLLKAAVHLRESLVPAGCQSIVVATKELV